MRIFSSAAVHSVEILYILVKLSTGVLFFYALGLICLKAGCYVVLFWQCVVLAIYLLRYETWILEDNHHKILCDAM